MQQLATLPSLWWALLLIPLLLLAGRRPLWLVPVFFVAGIVWVGFRAGLILEESLPPTLEGQDLVLEGSIADLPARTDFGWRFPFAVASASHAGAPAPAPGELWFTLLDVGQGLSAVARTATHTLVFDAGPRLGSFDTGRTAVAPFLRARGVERVDLLLVSHGDNDHLGGAEAVRQPLPVEAVLSSVPQRLAGASACAAGQRWQWDGVDFEMLNPPAGADGGNNDQSCVLRIATAHGRVLLPADIEARAERRLLTEQGERLRAERWWRRITAARPPRPRRSSPLWPRRRCCFRSVTATAFAIRIRRWSRLRRRRRTPPRFGNRRRDRRAPGRRRHRVPRLARAAAALLAVATGKLTTSQVLERLELFAASVKLAGLFPLLLTPAA